MAASRRSRDRSSRRSTGQRLDGAGEHDLVALHTELDATRQAVRTEMLGVVAAEFDAIHDTHRAVAVGSVDRIIGARDLRFRLIETVEQGLASISLPR